MQRLIICYDLKNKKTENYDIINGAISKYQNSKNIFNTTWVIVTDSTPEQVVEYLDPLFGVDDKLLVGPFPKGAYWIHVDDEIGDWLIEAVS